MIEHYGSFIAPETFCFCEIEVEDIGKSYFEKDRKIDRIDYIYYLINKPTIVTIEKNSDFSDDPDWRKEQYFLKRSDYADVLEHDSWIDCTDPKILSLRKMKAKKAHKKGKLTEPDLMNVMHVLKNSDFIDERTKKVYHLV
jgi:hypothetical protein